MIAARELSRIFSPACWEGGREREDELLFEGERKQTAVEELITFFPEIFVSHLGTISIEKETSEEREGGEKEGEKKKRRGSERVSGYLSWLVGPRFLVTMKNVIDGKLICSCSLLELCPGAKVFSGFYFFWFLSFILPL